MSAFALLAALLPLVATAPSPQPQQFDFAAILDAPAPSVTGPPVGAVSQISYSLDVASISAVVTGAATASITGASASAAATQALQKRQPSATTSSDSTCPTQIEAGTYCGFINPLDPCAVQPAGYGPDVTPDTVAAFEAYPEFHKEAESAVTPKGWSNVFRDLNASISGSSYLTYFALETYNVSECAAYCDSTSLCTAFNIFVERDPSINPSNDASSNATYCPNPSSITNYKCSLWGSEIDASMATNNGQYRDDFQVVIVASNGYDKTNTTTPPTVPGYTAPSNCSGKAISAGGDFWIGSTFFPGPFNPLACGEYASAQTTKNKAVAKSKKASSYTPANMFNAYQVKKNGQPQGTYCQLFDTTLDISWAQFSGSFQFGISFEVSSSWTYSLQVKDSGSIKW